MKMVSDSSYQSKTYQGWVDWDYDDGWYISDEGKCYNLGDIVGDFEGKTVRITVEVIENE